MFVGGVSRGGMGLASRLLPNAAARGAHTVFKTDDAGRVVRYVTFTPQFNALSPHPWQTVLRFDLSGPAHFNKSLQKYIPTPHVHDPLVKAGVRSALPADVPRP